MFDDELYDDEQDDEYDRYEDEDDEDEDDWGLDPFERAEFIHDRTSY